MTFQFLQSSLNYNEMRLANYVSTNFSIKSDLVEMGFFKGQEISIEATIEMNIFSIAFIYRDISAINHGFYGELNEKSFARIIVWMCHMNGHYISVQEAGQLFFAQSRIETYKNEIEQCNEHTNSQLPWHTYNYFFNCPLQEIESPINLGQQENVQHFKKAFLSLVSKYRNANPYPLSFTSF